MRLAAFIALLLWLVPSRAGAEATIPDFWDSRERLVRPDLSDLPRLRFLTTIDFPPFNFLDADGRLSGFHVDLARAVCAALAIQPKCQIQALPWDELSGALAAGQGEAILAGTAITAESRARLAFSRPYLQLPARFVMQRAAALPEPLRTGLAGRRVGVMAGSAHERILHDFFPRLKAVVYDRREWMLDDLRGGSIDAAFGDGMRLSFWIAGSNSAACCRFAGGPYLMPDRLGPGMAIAARAGDQRLVAAFDYALREIADNGTFAELYLRYFPVGFF